MPPDLSEVSESKHGFAAKGLLTAYSFDSTSSSIVMAAAASITGDVSSFAT